MNKYIDEYKVEVTLSFSSRGHHSWEFPDKEWNLSFDATDVKASLERILNTATGAVARSNIATISTITINNGGDGWSNASLIRVVTNGSNTTLPTFTVTLGGRAGRIKTEVLVAMGTISGDDPKDNALFSGV